MSKVCFRLGKIWQVVFRPEGFLEVSFQAWGCVVSWGSTSFQRVQNSAARLVVRALPHVHITPVLRHLHWLPVRARISYKTACLCFNATTSSDPAYLSDLLHLYSPSRSLRFSADTSILKILKIPLYKCKTKGDRAFSYFGPSVWNSLPLHIRNATTSDIFNSALKKNKTISSTSKNLFSSYLPDLLGVSVCVWSVVCACV